MKMKIGKITVKNLGQVTKTDWQGLVTLVLVVGYLTLKGLHVDVSDMNLFVGMAIGWWFSQRALLIIRKARKN